ncbi:MAG: PilW family protein [Pseudomonadota bacterium]|nr:PilW family protein [Pseudomonadota bacterium]
MIRARGFSLVELMVAITLALIVTAGVISVFVGSRSAFEATSGTAALTDGGRFALGFISNSVRGAGYMSCTTAPNIVGTLNAGATALPFSFSQALGGFEAVNTGPNKAYAIAPAPVAPDINTAHWVTTASAPTPGLDAALAGLPVQNNDVLVVRSTLKDAQTVYVSAIVDGAPSFTVNLQGSLTTAAGPQLAVISDCAKKGVVFQITNITPSPPNSIITHNGSGGPGGNSTSAFPFSFSVGAQVAPVDTVVYFIAPGADQDSALWVSDLNATTGFTTTELVPDIEAMQILYGVDTSGAQAVTNYVTADKVTDFNTVMSVKVALLAASAPGSANPPAVARTFNLLGTTVTAPIDRRSRQVFEETIAVRNALP